ncbi:MAG: methyltransferase domain-containing protein [bacterium]|nr:methyltransferase domain-containing protein [bacterium]
MPHDKDLPEDFLAGKALITERYLHNDDPYLQFGFGGGAERWRNERRPILEAVDRDGTILDLGCANGFLLECLVSWANEDGFQLIPYGVDQSAALIELARKRLPRFQKHLFNANVWSWIPPRRFDFVYTLADVVPEEFLGPYLRRLRTDFLEPSGRLIIGSYGSDSRGVPPLPLETLLPQYGLSPIGSLRAGPGKIIHFAWVQAAAS